MPFSKFSKNDIFYNKVKTFPKNTFVIYDSKVYHNNFKNLEEVNEDGLTTTILGTEQGFISLHELNINRRIDKGGSNLPPAGHSIYPFVTKEGARTAFKTVSTSEFDSTAQFSYGDVIKGDYPLTSSIKRTRFTETSVTLVDINNDERFHGSYLKLTNNKRFINSLKNTFNYYVPTSHHYAYDRTAVVGSDIVNWDKSKQDISLVEIPSIFYGSSIRKGSVILQTYVTGTLASECRDINKNGELIQVSGAYNAKANKDKVAGVVLYNEGFLCLTGSWDLSQVGDAELNDNAGKPRWIDFAAGANDDDFPKTQVLQHVSYRIIFEGVNYVPTLTMMAHAPKGLYNNSTNPTSFKKNTVRDPETSKVVYKEYQDLSFEKLEHQEFPDPTGSFDKQTYISKIGIYDEQKRLIAVATLANPVRKTEERDYTFKLKLDF